MQDKLCSSGRCLGNKIVAVAFQPLDGDEEASGNALPGIVADRRNLALRSALHFEDFDVFQNGAYFHRDPQYSRLKDTMQVRISPTGAPGPGCW